MGARYVRVFTLSRAMAILPALMMTTSQFLIAREAAVPIVEPTRLVFEHLLAADASLFNQKWTFRTGLIIEVAIVRDLRVPTVPWAGAVEAALGRSCAARLGRMKNGPATVAADLIENRFGAGGARPSMAHLLTLVPSTLQIPPAGTGAYVLGLELLIRSSGDFGFTFRGDTLDSFLLSGTAMLSMLVSAAVELRPAEPPTLRGRDGALVADCR